MIRKLVKQGATTLMVSLPAKWLKLNKLEKGSEVHIAEIEDNLVISSKGDKAKKETDITLLNMVESSIRTLITNTYRRGFDKVNVKYETKEQFKVLKDVVKTRLIGFDITKKEKGKCVVESITEPSAEQFDILLTKIFYNISELFDAFKSMVEGKEGEDMEEIEERIQNYENFCMRVVSKKQVINKKPELLWAFLTLINHGQRELYHARKYIGKAGISPAVKAFLEDARQVFELIKKAYLEKNVDYLAKVHEMEKELVYKKGAMLLEKAKGNENMIVFRIMSAIRQFYQSNSPLNGLIL